MKTILFILLLAGSASAQSNFVLVANDSSNAIPVVLVRNDSEDQDMWPSVKIGMGTGFLFFGFGMILRMSKKVAGSYD